jgi:hypothetical protein
VAIWAKDAPPGRLVPEGWDDLVIDYADDSHRYLQAKSRQPHVGPFRDRETAEHLLDAWKRQAARLSDVRNDFVLVFEQPALGLEQGEHRLDSPEIAARLLPSLEASVGEQRAREILARSQLWIWPRPSEAAVQGLSTRQALPERACLPLVDALRSAIARAADANASASQAGRHGLSVTDVTSILYETTPVLDRNGLMEAVARGTCEAIDLLTPLDDSNFYLGVDVAPGHVAAGLTISRAEELRDLEEALSGRRVALVVGPSGAGKSALLWMAAYDHPACRWYRVRRLVDQSDVDLLVRLARAHMPSEHRPVGFVVDNIGQSGAGAELWDTLVRELALLPGTRLLGAAREEDLFLIETLASVRVVRPRLTEDLAPAIYEALSERQLTTWKHWLEPYEQSGQLLLEFLHLLTAGRRLTDVVADQVRGRRRERRDLELSILAVAGTASAWGAEVPLPGLVEQLGATLSDVSAALSRLVGEHLLQQRADGSIAALHRLRSRAIFDAIHDAPPPTAADSVLSVLRLLPPRHLQPFLVGVLIDTPTLMEQVVPALATLISERGAETAAAAIEALRIVEFRWLAARWLDILERERVPPAMRSITAQFALLGSDLSSLSAVFDPRVVAATEKLSTEQRETAELRMALLAALPAGWAQRLVVAQHDCRLAARLLAAFDGLGDVDTSFKTLPGLSGSPLEQAIWGAGIDELSEVLACGRAVSTETAHALAGC